MSFASFMLSTTTTKLNFTFHHYHPREWVFDICSDLNIHKNDVKWIAARLSPDMRNRELLSDIERWKKLGL